MSKYDIQLQNLQRKAQADNNTFNNINSIVENGAKLVNQVGAIVGNQQASDYMKNFSTSLQEEIDKGTFDYKTDDNGNEVMLSAEEREAKYKEFITQYTENAPTNLWAQAAIKKSLDGQYERNMMTIYSSGLQHFEELKSKSMENYDNNIITTEISNPTAFNESTISSFSFEYEDLDNYAKQLFDSGNSTDSKLLGIYLNTLKWGDSPQVSKNYAESKRNNIAIEQFKSDAYVSFNQNVLNGSMDYYDWCDSLLTDIKKIGVENGFGATTDLTPSAETNLYNIITEEVKKQRNAAWERNDTSFEKNIKPVMQSFRDRSQPFTSTEARKLENQYDINPNMLSPEIKELYTSYVTQQDDISALITAFNQADSIASKPLWDSSIAGERPDGAMTKEEKQNEYNNIAATLNYNPKLRVLFESWHDSTPYYSHYAQFSDEQILEHLSGTFILPTIDTSIYSMDESDAGSPETDQDINALLADDVFVSGVVQLALSSDPDVMVSGAYSVSTFQRLWESTLTDEQKAEYRADYRTQNNSAYGMLSFDNKTQREITGEEFSAEDRINRPSLYLSDKANDDFYNWLNNAQDLAINFIMRNGNVTFADGETTLNSIIDEQTKEITSTKSNITNNHYVSGNDPALDYLASENAKNIFANALMETDPNKREMYLLSNSSNLSENDWNFINDFFDPENGYKSILEEINVDPTLIANSLNLNASDPSTIKMFANAIYENAGLIMQAKNNEAVKSTVSQKISESMKQERDAAAGNPFGVNINGSVSEYSDIDSFAETISSDWKKSRYNDPNSSTSDIVSRAISSSIFEASSDPVMAASMYNNESIGLNADAAAISDKDAAILFMAKWVGFDIQNPSELSERNKQEIWNIFNNEDNYWKALGQQYISGMMAVRGTIAELYSEYGINAEGYINGRYLINNDDTVGYITPKFNDKGQITALYYKESTDNSFGDGINLFLTHIGSGLDSSMKQFTNELNNFAPWGTINNIMGDQTSELYQSRADYIYSTNEEWIEFDSIAQKVFGHSFYPVAEQGFLDPWHIRFTDSSQSITHNSTGIDFQTYQTEFENELMDSIPDSIRRGFSAGRINMDSVNEYAHTLLNSDKWQKIVKEYEQANEGKTLDIEVSYNPDSSVSRIARGQRANIFGISFIERSK